MVFKSEVGGIRSLNGEIGDVTLTSSGNTVTITTPTSNTINLETSGGGSTAFNAITSGTNNAAAMVVGTGASLSVSGSGTISATSSSVTNALASATTTVNVSSAVAPTTGQVLTATGSSAATWQTPGGAYSPIPTTVVTGTTQAMSTNNAYGANNAAQVVFTLPSTFAVGDEMIIMGLGAGGWKIAQNASQLIHMSGQVTTTGTGGSLSSGTQYDTVHLKALVANTTLTVIGAQGTLIGV